jgi:hypothetical protein
MGWTTIEEDVCFASVNVDIGAIAIYVGGKDRARELRRDHNRSENGTDKDSAGEDEGKTQFGSAACLVVDRFH